MIDKASPPADAAAGTAGEVLIAFLRLGCTSFGGPIAHLGYFRSEFVERRKWCAEETFVELLALAQSMPGPASSQVAFALGLLRARWAGGLAAWVGFTTPSALLMLAFAFGHRFLTGKSGAGVVHGLQLVAVAVVAQAILAMQKSLAPDRLRMALALMATTSALFCPGLFQHFTRHRCRRVVWLVAASLGANHSLAPGSVRSFEASGRDCGSYFPDLSSLAPCGQESLKCDINYIGGFGADPGTLPERFSGHEATTTQFPVRPAGGSQPAVTSNLISH